ncbi:MAG: glycine dehydrogenase, partial [Promethearchaeota archaeon]
MDFTPHSEQDIALMMERLGINDLMELFNDIPEGLILDNTHVSQLLKSSVLNHGGTEEWKLFRDVEALAEKNKVYKSIFQGGGCYNHYIPSIVDFLVSRGEFWTSYTPYQAEISQGYLQVIFEYQSLIANLTGMKYSNASLHDGATATVDAIVMSLAHNRPQKKIILAGNISPIYLDVIKSSLMPREIELKRAELDSLDADLNGDVAAVVLQSPDFFGNILDIGKISQHIKEKDSNTLV